MINQFLSNVCTHTYVIVVCSITTLMRMAGLSECVCVCVCVGKRRLNARRKPFTEISGAVVQKVHDIITQPSRVEPYLTKWMLCMYIVVKSQLYLIWFDLDVMWCDVMGPVQSTTTTATNDGGSITFTRVCQMSSTRNTCIGNHINVYACAWKLWVIVWKCRIPNKIVKIEHGLPFNLPKVIFVYM